MTDQLRQAAQQALEALIDAANVLSAPMFVNAVAALRTALEQQQAEPVAWDKPSASFNEWWDVNYEDLANPFEKDSAAWWAWAGWKAAQRPWVGLTEFQFVEIYNRWNDSNGSTPWGLNQALEAKLKELNK